MVFEKIVAGGIQYNLNDVNDVMEYGTLEALRLKKAVPPNDSIEFFVKWHYTIPGKKFLRSGAIDSTSMFIGYWYPEMDVIDDIGDIFGTDQNIGDYIQYDGSTEFYHDVSDYDVELTVPDNFMVWASVAPENKEQVYSKTVLNRLANAANSKDRVQIIKESDFRKTATGTLTWKYKAKDFPDFAFALSDHYLWDAATYTDAVGSYFVQTAYPSNHPEFAAVLDAMKVSLNAFHTTFPIYPFPYKYFTIFNGQDGGGMEFPGMANDGVVSAAEYEKRTGRKVKGDMEAQLEVTSHEMCHMYFPFLMGINEKRDAWMEEGFASFSTFFIEPKSPENNESHPYYGQQNILPVMAPSYADIMHTYNTYYVSSYAYYSLYKLLGRDAYFKCLHAFMNEWKHKRPTPYDYMFTFNRISGQDLNWFWNKWYFDWGYMDVGITGVKEDVVTIQNIGGRPMAFDLITIFTDNTTATESVNPRVWEKGNTYIHKVETGGKKIKSIQLDIPQYGDADGTNNLWTAVSK